MISYLGSLVQFSPATGRAGRCRRIPLCVYSTPRVPATLGLPRSRVSVLSPSTLLRFPAALYGAGPAFSAVPVFGSSTKARIRLHLRFVPSPAWAAQAARGLGALSPDVACLSPLWPQRAQVGCLRLVFVLRSWPLAATLPAADVDHPSREFFRYKPEANLQCRRGWLLWGWVCPFPLPPASYLQRGWAGSSLEFLSPFVLRTAGSVFGPVNFLPCCPTV